MNREILFHGRRMDNGQWVEGYYFERKDTQGNIIESVIIVDAYEQISGGQRYVRSNLNHECFRVDPDTVGQFTGLTDKNGRKVFEGDIVRSYDPDSPECKMDCGVGQVEFYAGLWYVSGDVHNGLYDLVTISCKDLVVIGNVHDNPELLDQ